MTTDGFFDENTEQSAVKAEIVSRYFGAWARVIMPTAKKWGNRIAYIDLFAGPGRYKNGKASTPLLILERAINDSQMSQMLVTWFNDFDANNTKTLEDEIRALPRIESLKYAPRVYNNEVGSEIVQRFEQLDMIPTLFFVDPWGYKGLSLKLINSVLKNWGCDCIFFFNYNRINAGIRNPKVKEHMDALFGEERAEKLRQRVEQLDSPRLKEFAVIEEISQALKDMGGKYVLPFRFKNERGTRTSHHLIFVSKHPLGYKIMKEIMAGQSSSSNDGVPSFEYNPADRQFQLLFKFTSPLSDLADMLLTEFAGQTLTMSEIYERHNIDRPFIERNYKDVLLQLEAEGKIVTFPSKRKKGTFAGATKVTFPAKGDQRRGDKVGD